MTFGFQQPYPIKYQAFVTESNPIPDGRNWVLLEPLVYKCKDGRLVRAKIGSTTDGLSTPQSIWNILPPMGKLWFSGVLHDSGYRGTMEILNADGTLWLPYVKEESVYDNMIDEALDSQGASWFEKVAIYKALELFGHVAFAEDRKNVNSSVTVTQTTTTITEATLTPTTS